MQKNLLLAIALSFTTPLWAQNPAAPIPVDPGHPRVNEVNRRENRQQGRIENGVKNGTLTNGEVSHLEKGEQKTENREAVDKADHNGHLTKGEQRQLNREENRESRRIRGEKREGRKREEEKKQ